MTPEQIAKTGIDEARSIYKIETFTGHEFSSTEHVQDQPTTEELRWIAALSGVIPSGERIVSVSSYSDDEILRLSNGVSLDRGEANWAWGETEEEAIYSLLQDLD